MTQYEELEVKLQEMLSLQQQIRLFAINNLTEDNPFRPLIESQSQDSADEIRSVIGKSGAPVNRS